MSTGISGWVQMDEGVTTIQAQSTPASKQLPTPLLPKPRKHAALKGKPTVPVSAEQWENINRAIVKTVELILTKNLTLDSFGPDYWEMDEGLGIALVAEIRRRIKEVCTLGDPKLQRKLMEMARDVTHKEFRFSYRGGGVWFRFKMTDLQKAVQPITIPKDDVPPNSASVEKNTPSTILRSENLLRLSLGLHFRSSPLASAMAWALRIKDILAWVPTWVPGLGFGIYLLHWGYWALFLQLKSYC